jgi:hypothetical protein
MHCLTDISCHQDAIHAFIKSSRAKKASLYLFNNEFQTVYENALVSKVEIPPLEPKGSYPYPCSLLDAIGTMIKRVESFQPKSWADMEEDDDNVTIIVVSDTTEHANGSSKFTHDQIGSMIYEKKAKGWLFVFLSTNHDVIQMAHSIHMSTMSFKNIDVALQSISY